MDHKKLELFSRELMKATQTFVKAVGWPAGCSTCTPKLNYDPMSSLNPSEHVECSDSEYEDEDEGAMHEAQRIDFKKEDKKYYLRQTLRNDDNIVISHQYICIAPWQLPHLIRKIWKKVENEEDKTTYHYLYETFLELSIKAKEAIKKKENQ